MAPEVKLLARQLGEDFSNPSSRKKLHDLINEQLKLNKNDRQSI